jgi:hypothetical protein
MKVKKLIRHEGLSAPVLSRLPSVESDLERVLGRLADRVEVEWEPGSAGVSDTVRLRLSFDGSSGEQEFKAADLNELPVVRRRMRDTWSSVLSDWLYEHLDYSTLAASNSGGR